MGRAQCEAALIVALRHRIDRGLRTADDGRQDHDAQQDGGRQNRLALAAERPGQRGDDRHDHDEAEEAIDDGWDTGEQLDGRIDDFINSLRAEFRKVNRRQNADRHTDEDGTEGDIHRAHDHRQDTEDFVLRLPDRTGQELLHTDLQNRRDAIGEEKVADQDDEEDAHACEEHEYIFCDALTDGGSTAATERIFTAHTYIRLFFLLYVRSSCEALRYSCVSQHLIICEVHTHRGARHRALCSCFMNFVGDMM